jgi:hypothetical protein
MIGKGLGMPTLSEAAAAAAPGKPRRRSGRSRRATRNGTATGGRGRRGRPDDSLSRRWTGLVLLAVCVLSVVVGILAFDRLPSLIGDNAEFMILARSLAVGNGFRYINHPENRPATKYPLGFPAMLAGWITVFGNSVVSMKVSVLVCYVAACGLTFLVGRRLLGWSYGSAAALLVVLSAPVLEYSHQVLSDVPYMLFSLVGIYLLLTGYRARTYLIAGLAVCVWAFVVRSAGISLVVAAAAFLFARRRKKAAVAILVAAGAAAVLWSWRNYAMTGEGSRYMQVLFSANPYDPDLGMITLRGLLARIWINGSSYLGGLLPTTVIPTLVKAAPEGARSLNVALSLVAVTLIVIGGYSLRKKALLVNIYMLLYFAVYLVWPEVWRSERFMVPVAPLAAVYLVWGIRTTLAYFGVKRIAILAACGVLVSTNMISLSHYAHRDRGYPVGWVRYFQTAEWARANTAPDSVVLCRKPFLYYLFSDRKTISYPFTRDHTIMREYLYRARPDYIVLDKFGAGTSQTDVYLVPVLEGLSQYISLAFQTEEPVNVLLRFNLPEGSGNEG